MQIITSCFLVRDGRVLLQKKNSGLGSCLWNGCSTRGQGGETFRGSIVRVLKKENSVLVEKAKLNPVADLTFFFGGKPKERHVIFAATEWQGTPDCPYSIAQPGWFGFEELIAIEESNDLFMKSAELIGGSCLSSVKLFGSLYLNKEGSKIVGADIEEVFSLDF